MRVKSFADASEAFERVYFEQLLKLFKGNVTHAADAAGVSRRTVQWKIINLEIDVEAIRRKAKRRVRR
ncbi:hypothetical protein HZB60_10875 [candidate division KSB1 bacterium]|nr:hypothetical protein [candidate division KSB1 bacterium]